jgi:hypothetical protein
MVSRQFPWKSDSKQQQFTLAQISNAEPFHPTVLGYSHSPYTDGAVVG